MNRNCVGRFAPSPSGYMHMGNLLAMLLAWLDCRSQNGRILFRMEDLDPARSKPEYIAALADDLRWLGLDWDAGYPDRGYSQSERTALYEDAFEFLRRNDLVYPCYCSRAERLAAASAPHEGEASCDHSCRCAGLSAKDRSLLESRGQRPAWKIRVPDKTITVTDGHYGSCSRQLARDDGDFIVRRRDGVFAYQLAVSVDDMLMGVTRVVRGRDLLSSAPRQAWLIETLGGTPPSYCHAPLLTAGNGKLSKRIGSLSTQILRRKTTPEALTGRLAFLCGLTPSPEPLSPTELVPFFSWDKIATADIPLPD